MTPSPGAVGAMGGFFPCFKILFYLFLFLAVLAFRCCARAFSSRGERDTLRCGARASHCGGFSCCGARALGARASVVVGSVVVARGL